MGKRFFSENTKPGVLATLILLGAFVISVFVAWICSQLDAALPSPMESSLITLCGWISVFTLFFSLYTHLYRWRRSRNGSPARLAAASVVLSALVAFVGAFFVGQFFIDIKESVFFLILIALLTIIDLICSKPWEELDEIDRTCKSK